MDITTHIVTMIVKNFHEERMELKYARHIRVLEYKLG